MRITLTLVFALIASMGMAQKITLSISTGVGTYAMKDLKTFQTEMKEQFAFEPTITDEFPPFIFYEATAIMQPGKKFFFGVGGGYGSTGGRVQYRDYSGYLRSDQLLTYVNITSPAGVTLSDNKWKIQFDLRPTFTLTKTQIVVKQEVAGTSDGDQLKFNSQSLAVQPGFIVTRKINRFGIYLQGSYYVTVAPGKMYLDGSDELYLTDTKSNPLHAGWDGARLSIGVSVNLKQ